MTTQPRKPQTGPLPHTSEATPLKRQTDELVQDKRLTSARCPKCGIDRPTFRDKSFTLYFARHQQSGRSTWCEMSNKQVKL